MSEMKEFDERIKKKFAEHQEKVKGRNHAFAQQMQKIDEKFQRYSAEADRLTQTVLRPRMERLAAHFDNASVRDQDDAGACSSTRNDFRRRPGWKSASVAIVTTTLLKSITESRFCPSSSIS